MSICYSNNNNKANFIVKRKIEVEREKLQYQEESKIYGIQREHLSFRKVNLDLVCSVLKGTCC